jgi:hypothetical protein
MNLNKLNLIWWFLNKDDPSPPFSKWRDKPEWMRHLLWYVRNPLHNFTFYVIGMADKLYNRWPNKVFNPATPCYKWNIILPFISYKGKKVKWYIGWRERGNFGIKLNWRSCNEQKE